MTNRFAALAAERLQRIYKNEDLRLTVLAVAIGAAAAYAAIGFRWLISVIQWIAFDEHTEKLWTAASKLPWWHLILVPTVGGLIVGVMVRWGMSARRPQAVADVIEAAQLRGGKMSLSEGLKATVISAMSIGSGASVGREGPAVLLGAAIASGFGKWMKMSPGILLTLVGCGVGSAIAASFNAPIAGALFALEVVIGHYRLRAFAPVVIASVTGTVISRAFYGDYPAFIKPVYDIASFWELPAFALLGVVCAIAAMVFMTLIIYGTRYAGRIPGPVWLRPAYAGLLVGLIALVFPQVLGVGYEATDTALKGGFGLWILLALAIAKTIATAISLAGGFGGGVFSPSLVIGALVGGAFGIAATTVFPELSSGKEAYTLVGMGACAAAVLGAPISTILIVFELTGDYAITIAVMVAVVIATLITQTFLGRSFFSWQLAERGTDPDIDPETRLMRATHMHSLMTDNFATIDEAATLDEVRAQLAKAPYEKLFVVKDGRFAGVIALGELYGFAYGGEDSALSVDALIDREWPRLTRDATLETAVKLFFEGPTPLVPVVESEADPRLVGIVTQSTILRAYRSAHEAAREITRGHAA